MILRKKIQSIKAEASQSEFYDVYQPFRATVMDAIAGRAPGIVVDLWFNRGGDDNPAAAWFVDRATRDHLRSRGRESRRFSGSPGQNSGPTVTRARSPSLSAHTPSVRAKGSRRSLPNQERARSSRGTGRTGRSGWSPSARCCPQGS